MRAGEVNEAPLWCRERIGGLRWWGNTRLHGKPAFGLPLVGSLHRREPDQAFSPDLTTFLEKVELHIVIGQCLDKQEENEEEIRRKRRRRSKDQNK
jgi:hypothetical protein